LTTINNNNNNNNNFVLILHPCNVLSRCQQGRGSGGEKGKEDQGEGMLAIRSRLVRS